MQTFPDEGKWKLLLSSWPDGPTSDLRNADSCRCRGRRCLGVKWAGEFYNTYFMPDLSIPNASEVLWDISTYIFSIHLFPCCLYSGLSDIKWAASEPGTWSESWEWAVRCLEMFPPRDVSHQPSGHLVIMGDFRSSSHSIWFTWFILAADIQPRGRKKREWIWCYDSVLGESECYKMLMSISHDLVTMIINNNNAITFLHFCFVKLFVIFCLTKIWNHEKTCLYQAPDA